MSEWQLGKRTLSEVIELFRWADSACLSIHANSYYAERAANDLRDLTSAATSFDQTVSEALTLTVRKNWFPVDLDFLFNRYEIARYGGAIRTDRTWRFIYNVCSLVLRVRSR